MPGAIDMHQPMVRTFLSIQCTDVIFLDHRHHQVVHPPDRTERVGSDEADFDTWDSETSVYYG